MFYNDYIKRVEKFKAYLKSDVEAMRNDIASSESALEKYDIIITVNGNSLTIPMNADSYSRLEQLLEEEIQEAIDLK